MIPFGPRLNTVFASRWKALLWAGGILLTAYCTVPSAEQTAAADAQAQKTVHHNPWALDPKQR
jgi:GTP-dependent phosphoenolpyruvate carboxykinase